MALAAALAAIVVFAALAALANLASAAASRASAARRAASVHGAGRALLRARIDAQLQRRTRDELLAAAIPVGVSDTVLVASQLAWPWHRVAVHVSGVPVIAEVARADIPVVPWCAAAVTAGVVTAPAGTVTTGPPSNCPAAIVAATDSAIVHFDSAAVAALTLQSADTVVIASTPIRSGVWRARMLAVVAPGVDVSGVVLGPRVRVGAAASVTGLVVAKDSLTVASGAAIIANEFVMSAALRAHVALRPIGRKGLLLPP